MTQNIGNKVYSLCHNNHVISFRGLVGYGICLTRRTSPVRSWAKSVAFLFLQLLKDSLLN